MTEEELINDGWEKDVFVENIYLYSKTINNFHYTVIYDKRETNYNNWYKYILHIDTPDYCTVGTIEIDSLEHIYKIAEIYK